MRFILLLFLFGLIFVFSIHSLNSINQDIGRHLTLGKVIWQTKQVPGVNLFSYTNPNFSFINHHWLGELFLYFLSFLGLKGLIIFKAFAITIAFILAFFSYFRRNIFNVLIIAGLISIFIFIERTDVRPEIFSFLFLAWYLFVLFKRPGLRLFWTLPIVQLIWVNTHIYFFLGPMIFLLFFIGECLKRRENLDVQKKYNFKNLILIGLVIGAVNFINPFFWKGALYPLFVFKNYGYSIIENKSPFFLKAWGYPWLTTYALFAGIFLVGISFLVNYKNFRNNIFSFLLITAAAVMAFKMIRNYPIFALSMIPVVAKNFYESKGGVIPKRSFKNDTKLLIPAFFLLILILAVVRNNIYESAYPNKRFGLYVPKGAQAAVDFVRENNLKGPIFNNFDVGSFLIWKLPEEKVFIDGRPEAYPADFIQNVYIPMQEDPKKWDFYSEKYKINYVFWLYRDITPWSQKFLSHIIKNKDWPLIYKDNVIMIFVKNKEENRGIIEKYRNEK